MKYFKCFNSHNEYTAYTADTESFILPNVSYCKQENEVHVTPEETMLVAKYNVTSISGPTKILSDYNAISKMYIDGVEQPSIVIEYTFDTIGEHIVKYELIYEDALLYDVGFSEVTSLTSVFIPNWVIGIGAYLFEECTNLTSVTIPDSVIFVGSDAFKGCTSLPITDNIRYAGTCVANVVDNTLTSYTVKDGTKFIPGTVFSYCSNMSSITIPDSVVFIGESNFMETYQNFSLDNGVYYAGNCAIGVEDQTLTSYTLREGTKFLLDTFNSCENLTGVSIPNSVTEVGGNAFISCHSLSSIAIPSSVTYIGVQAFLGCSGLTSVNLQNGLAIIDGYAFDGCSNLTSINIPSGVTSIGGGAFNACDSLSAVTCLPTTPPTLGSGAFNYNASGRKILVPIDSVNAYRTATNWSAYASDISGIIS